MTRFSSSVLTFALATFVLAASLPLMAAGQFLLAHLQLPGITIKHF